MAFPGFNAEAALGPTVKKYRARSSYGSFGMSALSPQQFDEVEDLEEEELEEEELEEEEEEM